MLPLLQTGLQNLFIMVNQITRIRVSKLKLYVCEKFFILKALAVKGLRKVF